MQRLNLDMLNDLKMLMEDDFQLLVDTYCEDGADKLAKLKQSLREGNATEVREYAHSLKGSSSNIGAEVLSDLCFQMEAKGKDGDISNTEQLIQDISSEFQFVHGEIQKV